MDIAPNRNALYTLQDLRQSYVWMNQPQGWILRQQILWSKLYATWQIVERL
jgi:hypothetical protein